MISEPTLIALEFDRVRKLVASLAASSLGSERLAVLAPFATASEAEQAMMRTTEMVRLVSAADFPLHGLTDIREPLKLAAVAGSALAPEALLAVADVIHVADRVREFLASKRSSSPLLYELSRGIASLSSVAREIESAIAHDATVRDEASPALKRLRQSLRHETRTLEERVQSLLHKWAEQGLLQEAVISYRGGTLTLPVKNEMRHRVHGVIVDQSASGATVFMEPVETLEISNRLRQLELEEKREIHRILLELTALLHQHLDELLASLAILAELDEFYARAKLALRWDGVDAALNDRGIVRLLRGRHPLLIERRHDGVVPLTLELTPPLHTIVISGPNAGGKTVVLKTVGLLCVMAAAGLFVPAAPGTELPFVESLHADIGDSQSIESDLSTFTAHVGHLQRMIGDPVQPKLILIDEIGSSTDPALGGALAKAVLIELTRQRAITLVTTHHGALKAFAHETDGMMNGSMAFDEATLQPTYVFRAGLPGSSYAFEIAERVGFPRAILEDARRYVGEGMIGLEELVSELSRKTEHYEKLRRESDLKLTEYAALQKLYAERTREITRLKAQVKADALDEAEALLDKAGRDIETTLRDVKEQQANRESVKAARDKLAAMREDVEKTRADVQKVLEPEKSLRVPLKEVVIGARVEIEGLEGRGTTLRVQKGGKRVEVEIGGVRVWVDARRLSAAPEEPRRSPQVKLSVSLKTPYVSDRIDLRGKYGDEALPEIDSYLAAAAEAHLKLVTIIHGKGTGALRAKVIDFLNTHPLVKSFHDGGPRGDDFGSTVVELE